MRYGYTVYPKLAYIQKAGLEMGLALRLAKIIYRRPNFQIAGLDDILRNWGGIKLCQKPHFTSTRLATSNAFPTLVLVSFIRLRWLLSCEHPIKPNT